MSNKTKAIIEVLKFLAIPASIAFAVTFLNWLWKNVGSEEMQLVIVILVLLAATAYVIRILYLMELGKILRTDIQIYRDTHYIEKASTSNDLHNLIMRTFKLKSTAHHNQIEKEFDDIREEILEITRRQYLDS